MVRDSLAYAVTLEIFLPDFRFMVQVQIWEVKNTHQKNWLESYIVFYCSYKMTKTFVGSGYLDNYHVVIAWSTCASQIF